MSFLLGSLTDGLFGGARSVMSLYGMYQQIQEQDASAQASQEYRDQRERDRLAADTSTGGSAAAAHRHDPTQVVAPDAQAPAPTDTTTTDTPVFDTSKLRKANAVSAALGVAQGALKTDPHTNVGPSLDATRAQTDSVVNPSAQAGALATGTPPGAPVYAGGTSTQPAPAPDMAAQRDAFIRQRGLQLVGPPVKGATAVENGQRRQQANDAAAAEWDKSHATAATAPAPASTVVANPSAAAGGLAAAATPAAIPTGTTPGSPLAAPSLMQLPPPQVGAQASALPPMYDPATPGTANVGSKLTSILSQFNPISPVAAATPGAPPPVVPPHVAAASAGMPGQAPAVPPPPAPAPAPASPSAIQAGPPPGQPGAPGASTVAATQPVSDQEVKGALQHLRDTGAARQPDAQVAPAPVPAVDAARGEKPAGGPSAVEAPPHIAPVAPDQMGPVLQSEPTPTVPKPIIDPQYYNALTPNWKAMVDRVAAREGVDPARLAAHWWVESRMKTSSPDSSTGAQGILQVQPETRDMPGMDPKHLLDAQNPEGSMTLGARYMNLMDRQFGRNTALSALAYVAGPQNAMAVGQNPALLDQMPQSKAALDMLTGGKGIPQGSFTGIGDPPLPRQILDAAKRGPDAFQNYVIQNASYGGQVSDGWQRVETSMVAAALMRGDLAGASHARDLVFQMSHQGMFEHLLKAKQFLDAGQPGYAATEMANSHAFVPDGVVSQYGVGKDGSIWGRRMDPHDPTKPMAGPDGQPAEITPAMVTNTLAMVSDPRGYLKFSQEQQKIASEAEKNSAMAHYYEDLNPTRVQVASIKQQGIEQREYLREQQRGVDSQVKIQLEAQKEAAAAALRDNRGKALEGFAKQADAAFGSGATTPPTMADGSEMPQAQRAAAATVMNGLLSNAGPGEHTGTSAQYIASSVVQGAFKIKQASDGREGVFDQRGNLVGMLPPGTAARAGLAAQAPASQTAPPPSPSMSSEMPSQAIH